MQKILAEKRAGYYQPVGLARLEQLDVEMANLIAGDGREGGVQNNPTANVLTCMYWLRLTFL